MKRDNLHQLDKSILSRNWARIGLLSVGIAFAACGGKAGNSGDGDGDCDGDGAGASDSMGGAGETPTGGAGGAGTGGKSNEGMGGDSRTGGTGGTSSELDPCVEDEHVLDGACVSCPEGTARAAGDEPDAGDTACEAIQCDADQRVVDHACVACPVDSTNDAGDDASGENTECEEVVCDQLRNLVPVMSGMEDGFGVVTQSGEFAGDYPGWHAFDRTSSLWLSKEGIAPAWLAYEFKEGPRTVTEYSLRYTNGALTTRAPKAWSFQGWDGGGWVALDTENSQTAWESGEVRVFQVDSPAAYSAYRIYFTQDNDSRSDIVTVSVGQIELRGPDCSCDTTAVARDVRERRRQELAVAQHAHDTGLLDDEERTVGREREAHAEVEVARDANELEVLPDRGDLSARRSRRQPHAEKY
jgi:hypothetical protein